MENMEDSQDITITHVDPPKFYSSSCDFSTCRVFENPMLLDLILQKVIWSLDDQDYANHDDGKKSISRPYLEYARTCRLVCRDWVEVVNKIFAIRHHPLLCFHVGLEKTNLLSNPDTTVSVGMQSSELESDSEENVLDEDNQEAEANYASLVTLHNLIAGSISLSCLPCSLYLGQAILYPENNFILIFKIIELIGNNLKELTLFLREDNDFFIPYEMDNFKNVCLSSLRKCKIYIFHQTDAEGRTNNAEEPPVIPLCRLAPTDLLTSLMLSAINLYELQFSALYRPRRSILSSPFPINYTYSYSWTPQVYAKTLNTLKLNFPISSNAILNELCTSTNILSLKEVSLHISLPIDEDSAQDLIFCLASLMNKFAETLETFSLSYIENKRRLPNMQVSLPIMPKLKQLTLRNSSTSAWIFNDERNLGLDFFPNLESLTIFQGNDDILQFINKVPSKLLKEFSFVGSHLLSIDSDLSFKICNSLQNLRVLEICTWGPDKSGMQVIFKELRSLEDLKILIGGSPGSTPMDLDSLFTGIPSRLCKTLINSCNTDGWESSPINEMPIPVLSPSIRRLDLLKSLTIIGTNFPSVTTSVEMTYLSYLLAFFKMEALIFLTIGGNIPVSTLMQEQWMLRKGGSLRINHAFATELSFKMEI